MNDERGELMRQFGDILLEDMKPRAKRFADSLVVETGDTRLEIKGSPFISTLIDGRRPTSPNAPKGDPTLQEILYDWILANGIQAEGGKTQEQLSWAMAQSMHQHGDRLYQQGGGRDVFAEVLNEQRISGFASLIADADMRIIAETTLNGVRL